jgi:hypothetical protein
VKKYLLLLLLLVLTNVNILFSQVLPVHCDSLITPNQIINLSPLQDTVSFSVDNIALSADTPGLTDYILTSITLDNYLVIDSIQHTKTTPGLPTYLYSYQTYLFDIYYETSTIPNDYSIDGSFDIYVSGLADSTCHIPFTMKFNTVTAIETKSDWNEINVFPNPASSLITIDSDFPIAEIYISAISGETLLRTQEKTIDIEQLPNGIYFLKTIYSDKEKPFTINRIIKI